MYACCTTCPVSVSADTQLGVGDRSFAEVGPPIWNTHTLPASLSLVCALSVCWKHICWIEAAALSDFCLFSCPVYKFSYLLTYNSTRSCHQGPICEIVKCCWWWITTWMRRSTECLDLCLYFCRTSFAVCSCLCGLYKASKNCVGSLILVYFVLRK